MIPTPPTRANDAWGLNCGPAALAAANDRHHTPVPDGYVARSEDADRRLARGQRQERCPTCGLWAVWRTKSGGRAGGSGE
jgi:hypothetical protein